MATVIEGLIKRSWPALKPVLGHAALTAASTLLDLLAADYPQFAPVLAEAKAVLTEIGKL